jgi:hypothetical protein
VQGEECQNPVLPKLAHCSDVGYLQWRLLTHDLFPTPELRIIARDQVVNPTTVRVVKHILSKMTVWKEETWHRPQYVFTPESNDFLALLGSPNGAGVAYLLIQHKEGLGHKCVEKIKVMKKAGDLMDAGYMRIVFYIEDPKEKEAEEGAER